MTFDPVRICQVLNGEAVDDVIASKRAAKRPKDLRSLPYLESLRDADRA